VHGCLIFRAKALISSSRPPSGNGFIGESQTPGFAASTDINIYKKSWLYRTSFHTVSLFSDVEGDFLLKMCFGTSIAIVISQSSISPGQLFITNLYPFLLKALLGKMRFIEGMGQDHGSF